jgi:hypothetical protein
MNDHVRPLAFGLGLRPASERCNVIGPCPVAASWDDVNEIRLRRRDSQAFTVPGV